MLRLLQCDPYGQPVGEFVPMPEPLVMNRVPLCIGASDISQPWVSYVATDANRGVGE